MIVSLVIISIFIAFLYLLPSAIAAIRKARHDGAIILVNVIFGWTVLGWIAALIWAVIEQPREEPTTAEEAERVIRPMRVLTAAAISARFAQRQCLRHGE